MVTHFDSKGHPLSYGDIVRVKVRGYPKRKIIELYYDIHGGVRLDRAVVSGGCKMYSWNGCELVWESSPEEFASALLGRQCHVQVGAGPDWVCDLPLGHSGAHVFSLRP